MNKEGFLFNPEPDDDSSVERSPASDTDLAWLAGILELAGSIFLRVQRRGQRYVYVSPQLTINSSSPEVRKFLFERWRGGFDSINPNMWRLVGSEVAKVLSALKDMAPSRQAEIAVIEQWWHETDTQERVKLARAVVGQDMHTDVSVDQYHQLVQNDAFVAGIVDLRGNIYISRQKQYEYPAVLLLSANEPLLQALKGRFGGSINVREYAGSLYFFKGREFATTKNLYMWQLTNATARGLLKAIVPYVKTQPYEGWDKSVRAEQQAKIAQDEQVFLEIIKTELRLFDEGKIDVLSSNEELYQQYPQLFSSLSMVALRLRSLPADIKKKRESLRRHTTTISEEVIQGVVEAIIDEVLAYERGEIDRIKTNREWVAEGVVRDWVFNARVTPSLPPGIKKRRLEIIYKQGGKRRS